ncbi:cell division protein FtsQ/DivIB [Pseudaestuariivita atlantica]|uniref:Cell division protein FtsQ n=1 Tax=Pseudaestuariivita atlantica TaxID=1317121 RepID=A0A0L1JTT6_9RHOB|nr:cell division protein FtsQ/DivIB [Pseudaestuariivita atlantica]KNG95160.1 cell division protein FtsQ [Pseudaestuariivita atlantica]
MAGGGRLVQPLTAPPRTPPRADPAPTRWQYRWARLKLSPLFRGFVRVGLPFGLTLGAGLWYFSDQDRRDAMNLMIADVRQEIETRPEFMVQMMAVDGAGDSVSEDIREIVPVDFPVSSFDLDLDAIRDTITSLEAVRTASVRIRPGGVLQVQVTERVPVILWRGPEGLELVDAEGIAVGAIAARDERPDLPLIAGLGAADAVDEALAILASAAPLADRMRGLERMGERRWDVVLDRGQRILLPADRPVGALDRVIAMDAAQDMLARDIAAIDLRLPGRPTLRLNDQSLKELWRIKTVDVDQQ